MHCFCEKEQFEVSMHKRQACQTEKEALVGIYFLHVFLKGILLVIWGTSAAEMLYDVHNIKVGYKEQLKTVL